MVVDMRFTCAETMAAALGFCTEFGKGGMANLQRLAELGVVEYLCKAMTQHKQEDVALAGCSLTALFTTVTTKV